MRRAPRLAAIALAVLGIAPSALAQEAQPLPAAPPPPPASTPPPGVPPPGPPGPLPPGAPAPAQPQYGIPLPVCPPPAGYGPCFWPPPQAGQPPIAPPPGYVPPAVPIAAADDRPRFLPYDESQPIPPGYKVTVQDRHWPLVIGATSFAFVWLITAYGGLIAAINDDNAALLIVPVVGPFLYLDKAQAGTGETAFMVINGASQAIGAAFLIGGIIYREQKVLEKQTVAPTVAIGPRSAALRWRF